MVISEEVGRAVASGHAVVALESTVVAHGLPRPRNLEVGRVLEAEVRAGGATPATVAVIRGEPAVGLTAEQLERVAVGAEVLKLSTRDLPLAVARRADGATTVAATMWLAARAGISVFATGGIGGVHRGEPRDESADLTELGRTPMLVVCAGAKAILDLPATREALETAGVLVVGWKTDEFPGFYSVETGLGVDARVENPREAAQLWRAHRSLGLPGAMLLCVPPPASAAIDGPAIEAEIARSIELARVRKITGKAVTPFLLAEISRLTSGRSLDTNVALLQNNARVAAEVAVALVDE